MRTNVLRKVVKASLDTLKTLYGIKEVYYQISDDDAMFPHIVFSLESVASTLDKSERTDYKLVVDAYDRGTSHNTILNIADDIEDLFKSKNIPQSAILPTFFFESRRSLPDEDKLIKHEQITFIVQNYER